ncbi:MAG: hypothetical protein ACKVHR_12320 [Pirellulales bacterium]
MTATIWQRWVGRSYNRKTGGTRRRLLVHQSQTDNIVQPPNYVTYFAGMGTTDFSHARLYITKSEVVTSQISIIPTFN